LKGFLSPRKGLFLMLFLQKWVSWITSVIWSSKSIGLQQQYGVTTVELML
jgi:hypothetical protein